MLWPLQFLVIFQFGEVHSVSTQHRVFLLASLLPAFLLGSVFAVVQAQNAGAPAVRQTRWSEPATWPDRKVPAAGDKVTIARDKSVLLDVSPPALGSLTIDGKLSFADNADLELTTEWILLHEQEPPAVPGGFFYFVQQSAKSGACSFQRGTKRPPTAKRPPCVRLPDVSCCSD